MPMIMWTFFCCFCEWTFPVICTRPIYYILLCCVDISLYKHNEQNANDNNKLFVLIMEELKSQEHVS